MKKIKEIIRLSLLEDLSIRQISKAVNVSHPTATKYLGLFKASGLSFEEIKKLNNDEITELLFANFKQRQDNNSRYVLLSSKFEYFAKELKRKHVTLQKLWEEYIEENPAGYSRSQFCENFNRWRKSSELTMHLNHKAGDKMFVDFAGKKFYLTDRETEKTKSVETFVAILPASHYTFVCATHTQKTEDWIEGSQKAFEYFGGSTKAITPDCYKSAVTRFNRYDPEINPEYLRFAEYYDTVILPARPAHPKDKALVENAVKIVYSRIYASLRNEVFYSIEQLNRAILVELKKYNSRKMQSTNLSRIELFETTEKNILNTLPTQRYEHKKCSKTTIMQNYHVLLPEDKHYYSVPYQYYGKSIQNSKKIKAELYYTQNSVEIYFNNERIAVHKREFSPTKRYITNINHIPKRHQKFLERLNPEEIIATTKQKGEFIADFLEKTITTHKLPEQSYYLCKGILRLSKNYGTKRVNKACKKALYLGYCSYKAIRDMLKNGKEEITESISTEKIRRHSNVRGKEYFEKKLKEKLNG